MLTPARRAVNRIDEPSSNHHGPGTIDECRSSVPIRIDLLDESG
jgi:hypothetical protein